MTPIKTVEGIYYSVDAISLNYEGKTAGIEHPGRSAKLGLIIIEWLAHLTFAKEGPNQERVLTLLTVQVLNGKISVMVPLSKDDSPEERNSLLGICTLIKGIAEKCLLQKVNASKHSEKNKAILRSFITEMEHVVDDPAQGPFLLERAALQENLQLIFD